MQASWSLSSRSDDESVLTYDSPTTPISPARPYPSHAPFRPARHPYTLEAHQVSSRLNKPYPAHERELSFEPDLLEGFPMPLPRTRRPAMRPTDATMPSHFLDTAPEDDLEAAWEDGSGLDDSPRVEHSDRLADLARLLQRESGRVGVEDQFELNALRRQVEQLQMALQLQGHQLAVAESRQLRARRSVSQLQRESAELPPLPAVPNRGTGGSMRVMKRPSRSNLRPVGAGLVSHAPAMGESERGASSWRPVTGHPFAERRQSDASLVSTPSLSASTTADEKKIEDLNRKVEALEQLFAMLSAQSNPALQAAPAVDFSSSRTADSSASSASHSAFRYNTTPSARSITGSTTTLPEQPATKVNKLAAVFKSRTAPVAPETTRISWGRKKTDKDASAKVKVRQGPGRGRMVIKETAAS